MSWTGKSLLHGALLALSVCVTQGAVAAPIIPGFGTFQMDNAFSTHGLWFSDELVDTNGNGLNGAAQTWAVESATLTYTDLGGPGSNTLSIDGVVTNNGYSLGFDFDLVEIAHVGNPYCGRDDCKLSPVGDATQDHYDGVRYFDFPGMTGSSSTASIFGLDNGTNNLAGLLFDLTIKPSDGSKPPQFGYCANWVDCALGYSNWFGFERADSTLFSVDIDGRGNGDLNLSAVPVPAAVWLFGTALVGLVGFGKRRKQAA